MRFLFNRASLHLFPRPFCFTLLAFEDWLLSSLDLQLLCLSPICDRLYGASVLCFRQSTGSLLNVFIHKVTLSLVVCVGSRVSPLSVILLGVPLRTCDTLRLCFHTGLLIWSLPPSFLFDWDCGVLSFLRLLCTSDRISPLFWHLRIFDAHCLWHSAFHTRYVNIMSLCCGACFFYFVGHSGLGTTLSRQLMLCDPFLDFVRKQYDDHFLCRYTVVSPWL